MLTSLGAARSVSPPIDRAQFQRVLKTDPQTGFTEFPEPGDVKKHLLPVFYDPEEISVVAQQIVSKEDATNDKKEFWMPDKFCKVCYGCEDAFTMYRRRHHCRMCGQVFCNTCSSFYIDGALINLSGPVRACRLCHDQLFDRSIRENKQMTNRRMREVAEDVVVSNKQTDTVAKIGLIHETPSQKMHHTNNLQRRASEHLSNVVLRLVRNCDIIADTVLWSNIIVHLVREVVSSVDPNVRNGDSLDIRPYVKIKIIPGGGIAENAYINGVVFRKNVSHKKMAANSDKINPRILLLSGSIDFQRTDTRLASMDTLIEQEDKYIEILIDKIMSLRPDIILVGKAVARRAQELLCEHNVVVMQNVKPQLLERISRMTNAIMLQSTDHMIQQYGAECLGCCGKFNLRLVQDNVEKSQPNSQKTQRVLRTRILRGSTYAYFQGCPAEKGCTLVLRGADRPVLAEVKRIIQFCVMVAYHLRLEVAYYNDRFARLPLSPDLSVRDDDSDLDDQDDGDISSWQLRKSINQWFGRKSSGSIDIPDDAFDISRISMTEAKTSGGAVSVVSTDAIANVINNEIQELEATATGAMAPINPRAKDQDLTHMKARLLLSSSMDVDIGLAYTNELRGASHYSNTRAQLLKVSIVEHQSLLITSLLMNEDIQKSKPEVKGIRFYTAQDVALGQFLVENCFQLHKTGARESSMLDHVLCFAHRNSRIDVAVRKITSTNMDDVSFLERDPMNVPILMYSYCKECQAVVTPEVYMSDETWKMSFGKFMEICFYNCSARGRTNNCEHCVRDCHTLVFCCEGYEAKFDVIPLHPYALHVRLFMGEFPTTIHSQHVIAQLQALPGSIIDMVDLFLRTISTLENIAREVMMNRQDDLNIVTQDFRSLEIEIKASINAIIDEICICADYLSNQLEVQASSGQSQGQGALPRSSKFRAMTNSAPNSARDVQSVRFMVNPRRANSEVSFDEPEGNTSGASSPRVTGRSPARTSSMTSSAGSEGIEDMPNVPLPAPADVGEARVSVTDVMDAVTTMPSSTTLDHTEVIGTAVDEIVYSYPMYFKREAYMKARQWNLRLDQAYRFIEQIRQEALLTALQLQQTGTALPNLAALQITPLHALSSPDLETNAEGDSDDEDDTQLGIRKYLPSSAVSTTNLPPPPFQSSSPERPMSGSFGAIVSADIATAANTSLPVPFPMAGTSPGGPTMSQVEPTSSMIRDTSHTSFSMVESLNQEALGEYQEPPLSTISRQTSGVLSTSIISSKSSLLDSGLTEIADSRENRRLKTASTRILQPINPNALSIPSMTASSKRKENAYHLPKALARLMMGKEVDVDETKQKSIVPLGAMEEGRLNLKPGRKGEVIAVHEDEPATIIAYSLASEEYFEELQKFFNEGEYVDGNDGGVGAGLASPNDDKANNGISGYVSSTKDTTNDFKSNRDLETDPFADYQQDQSSSAASAVVSTAQSEQVSQAFATDAATDTGAYDTNFSAFGKSLFSDATTTAGAIPNGTLSPTDISASNRDTVASAISGSSTVPSLSSAAATAAAAGGGGANDHTQSKYTASELEKQMKSQRKVHARHTFVDVDEKKNVLTKFYCTSYWAGQFEAIRTGYLNEDENVGFIKSLSMSARWGAQGGKSGAHFSKSMDERFVVKVISKVELQMFNDFAPAFFEYMAKAYYHNLPTVLCKVLGVYTIGSHNKETGKKMMENVVVMENIFYKRNITKVFDLKGTSRARYVEVINKMETFDTALLNRRSRRRKGLPVVAVESSSQVLLDDNFMELTDGKPFPLKHRAKMFFQKAVMNDTLFLSLVNVVDYSILIGFDETNHEIVVGIIDYLRQYDFAKRVERMGKSVGMLAGQAEPTIIQPPQYKKRFYTAMERYFMTVPDKWIAHEV